MKAGGGWGRLSAEGLVTLKQSGKSTRKVLRQEELTMLIFPHTKQQQRGHSGGAFRRSDHSMRSGAQTCSGAQLCLPLWGNRKSGHICRLLFSVRLKVQAVSLWLDLRCVCVCGCVRSVVRSVKPGDAADGSSACCHVCSASDRLVQTLIFPKELRSEALASEGRSRGSVWGCSY